MSEKKAKEQRKQEALKDEPKEAQKVGEISIIVYGNGKMEVKHPAQLNVTINMLLDTLRLMYKQIIQVQGEPSKIISLKPGAALPKGALN